MKCKWTRNVRGVLCEGLIHSKSEPSGKMYRSILRAIVSRWFKRPTTTEMIFRLGIMPAEKKRISNDCLLQPLFFDDVCGG